MKILVINTNKNPDHKRISFELSRNLSKVISTELLPNVDIFKVMTARSVISPSPSPINVFLIIACRLLCKKIFVGVHDVVGHERKDGLKVFLYNWFISLFSNGVIVYSDFSRQQMLKKFPWCKFVVTYFLTAGEFGDAASDDLLHLKADFLYFGRACDYSGRNNLEYIVGSLPEKKFLLMGRGLPQNLRKYPNVTLLNRKFTDAELVAALNSCHTVIFPYNSATQSGGIPLAVHHYCNIVYFDVGGLSDQMRLYPSWKIEAGNINEFINKMRLCKSKLSSDYSVEWKKSIDNDNYKSILELIQLAS